MRFYSFVLVLLFLTVGILSAQNPILAPTNDDREQTERAVPGDLESPTFTPEGSRQTVGSVIRAWSNTLQRQIAELSRRLREEGDLSAAVLAFLAAVLFGAIHIAGPGHGKVFALSYFSSRESRPRDGLVYSGVVSIIDSLSALVVVVLGYMILSAVAPAFRTDAPRILGIVSYSLVVVLGLWHLAGHLFGGHTHSHDDHDHASSSRKLRPWMLAISVGLVPCPVSTILLVYGVVNNVLGLMIVMVVGVSIGGFITMSVISLLVIAGRKGLLERVSSGAVGRISTVLEFLSSGLIIAAGLLLLFAALS